MPFNTLSFAIVIGALLIAGAPMAVNAHSRFGCPSPRSNDFGEKSVRAPALYSSFNILLKTFYCARYLPFQFVRARAHVEDLDELDIHTRLSLLV